MKKLSIGTFAILAIVLAVASAFSTNEAFVNKFRIFKVGTSLNPASYSLPSDPLADHVIASEGTPLYDSNIDKELAIFYEEQGPDGAEAFECESNSSRICLVKVELDASEGNDPEAVEIMTGVYDPAPF